MAKAADYFVLRKATASPRLPCVVRVMRLLRLMQDAERFRVKAHPLDMSAAYGLDDEAKLLSMRAEGDALLSKLNRQLMRYRWTPAVHRILWLRLEAGYRRPRQRTRNDMWENFAVWWLLRQITGDGDTPASILRFKQCHRCSRWFYAVTNHQTYCSNNCRQKDHADSPEFRAKRARYMREKYRPNEKERVRDAIKGVKHAKAKKA